MSEGSLVVFGSGGRHISFTKSDLKLPSHLVEQHGDAAAHFVTKQWPTMCTFWMNRVLKDSKLHHLSVDDVIQRILDEALSRFHKKKEEQQLHKKRKRLLENTEEDKGAGIPQRNVLIVNFVDLKTYLKDKPASDAIIDAVLDACRSLVGGKPAASSRADGAGAADDYDDERRTSIGVNDVIQHRVLVDELGELPAAQEAAPTTSAEGPAESKGRRTEGDGIASSQIIAPSFDDRVALVVQCANPTAAATIIAKLHGRVLEGRVLSCRFIGD
jgi:hypothetical protein